MAKKSLDLTTLISSYLDVSIPVLNIISKTDPSFLIDPLIKQVRTHGVLWESLVGADSASVMSKCSMSFLGNHNVFWVGHIEGKTIDQKKLIAFLQQYNGPHRLLFYSEHDFCKQVIEIPDRCNKSLFISLCVALKKRVSKDAINTLFSCYPSLSFSDAVKLMLYLELLGADTEQFFNEWLDLLIEPEISLFRLSQYLFEQNGRKFFKHWRQFYDSFAVQFWITFFSEQCWRAYWYTLAKKRNDYLLAKKISYRLPFSFINQDYRRCSSSALYTLHQRLYALDHQVKNGTAQYGLDAMLAQFFMTK